MKRHALFVGVDKYDDPQIQDLRFAGVDAHSLNDFFAEIGYDVKYLPSPTKQQVLSAVRERTAGLAAGDSFFFYFAGHGFTHGGRELLFCRDDFYEDLLDDDAGLKFDKLRRWTEGGGTAYSRVFVLDVCRSNFLTGTRGVDVPSRDLAPASKLVAAASSLGSFTVLRSCSPGQVALEVESRQHGLFTCAFLDKLREVLRTGARLEFNESFGDAVAKTMKAIAAKENLTAMQTPDFAKSAGCAAQVLIEGREVPPASPVVGPAPSWNEDADIYVVEAEAKELYEQRVAKAAEPSDAALQDLFRRPRLFYSAASSALSRGDAAAARKLFADFTQSVATYETAVAEAARKAEAARRAELARLEEEKRQADAVRLSSVGVKAGDVQEMTLPGGAKMKFVWCPPGTFTMGSPPDEEERNDNETQHRVVLTKGFWLGQYEVTQAQWRSVMGNNPSEYKGDRRPVESVSWDDCRKFIAKCNAAARGVWFALPTEAQWEYACRAGTTGPYAGTRNLDELGWYVGNNGRTHRVGRKRPNAWNLYDMHGNVKEWCADRYGEYEGDCTDPMGPASGDGRVLRGGGWNDDARYCRSAYRDWYWPDNLFNFIGFRLLCSAVHGE